MVISINNRDPIRVAQKLSNQSVSNQITLQDDDELQLPLEVRRRYAISGFIGFHLSGIISGYRFTLTEPPGSLISYAMAVYNCASIPGALVNAGIFGPNDPAILGVLAAIGDHWCHIHGQIEVGDTDGLLKFQFAQNVADAAIIRIGRTSFLQVTDFGE
jgi:hypothetical protein